MAEAAKTQEPSTEELRARIRRIIAEDDDKPGERPRETASPESDTAAPPPTQALYSSALLSPAAVAASPTPQSSDTGSGSTTEPVSRAGLYARQSGSAPLFDYPGKQVPMPSSTQHASSAEQEKREEPLLRHSSEHVPIPSHLPDAAPGREEQAEPRSGHAGRGVAISSHRSDSAPAPGGADWQQLVSRETNNAVHSAFDALTQTVLLHNARTLEDMVREMLRPILKVWLDDNLPGIVEGLVRAEIDRARRPARGDPSAR
jgi:cell pole-organizing protein PopZ